MGRRISTFYMIVLLALTLTTASSLNAVRCQAPYVKPTVLRPGNVSGVVVLKIYPDDSVGLTGTFEANLERPRWNVSIPRTVSYTHLTLPTICSV